MVDELGLSLKNTHDKGSSSWKGAIGSWLFYHQLPHQLKQKGIRPTIAFVSKFRFGLGFSPRGASWEWVYLDDFWDQLGSYLLGLDFATPYHRHAGGSWPMACISLKKMSMVMVTPSASAASNISWKNHRAMNDLDDTKSWSLIVPSSPKWRTQPTICLENELEKNTALYCNHGPTTTDLSQIFQRPMDLRIARRR